MQNIHLVLTFIFLSLGGGSLMAAVEKATFAGGCFWCMVKPFDTYDGVLSVVSGYTGGDSPSPSYALVSSGKTDHVEAVQISFDPEHMPYETLLDIFWRQIDPTDDGGQFVDRGKHYRTAIFYHSTQQKETALSSKAKLDASGRFKGKIVTPILEAKPFYPAEEYHQDFYKKNPGRYTSYRQGSGRDAYLNRVWADDIPKSETLRFKKPDNETLKETLTPMQYDVTQKDCTEAPFDNAFWDHKEAGIYVDIVSGEPLFASVHKYDSKSGWPSFFKALEPNNIVEKSDFKLFWTRTEVRSRHGNSHLGHVFDDGPAPTGLRYCINSAALRFIPKADLEKEGFSDYLPLFQ